MPIGLMPCYSVDYAVEQNVYRHVDPDSIIQVAMEAAANTGASALARKLDAIRDEAGVQGREIAQLLGTTPQTVSRWRTGKAEPQRRSLDRLLTLAWLAEELAEFYRPDEARLWLFSPHRLLEGQRPADRIEEGRVDDVLALIAQLRDGSYA